MIVSLLLKYLLTFLFNLMISLRCVRSQVIHILYKQFYNRGERDMLKRFSALIIQTSIKYYCYNVSCMDMESTVIFMLLSNK